MKAQDDTVKIQIPIARSVRDKLEQKATDLGFDSLQAYVRFWAKAEVDGRKVDLSVDDWGQPSPAAAARINRDAEEAVRDSKAGKLKSFDDPKQALAYLNNL